MDSSSNESRLQFFINQALSRHVPLSEIFIDWECRDSGKTRHDIWETMVQRVGVMHDSLSKGLETPQKSRSGYINGSAYQLNQHLKQHHHLLSPAFTKLLAYAMAIPEVNACMGRIVAAPTAGSSGVLPAVILTIAEEHHLPEAPVISAFFTAGGIGMVIERLATVAGAQGGCQAEVGSASAMAAGAVVEMMGGTPSQVGDAVAFALKNLMGLICDPVAGLVEIPCVKRNALGAVNAVAAAEMALTGLTSLFTADQVIETMGKVGKRLPEEFRETAKGGIAALPRPNIQPGKSIKTISTQTK